jgi:transcriptional regulator with XRE-family HTH domain
MGAKGDEPADHPFSRLLRRYRLAAGLTQEELAERAGVSRRSIGDMERGLPHVPHKENLTLLAETLGLSPEERRAFVAAARGAGRLPAQGADGGASTAGAAVPPLVGRMQELDLLQRHLENHGAPPLLLLAGEPGIGKSRLLQAAAALGAARGLRVLAGGCGRRGDQEPYAPVLGALEAYLRRQPAAERQAVLRGCGWLARLLPEIVEPPVSRG